MKLKMPHLHPRATFISEACAIEEKDAQNVNQRWQCLLPQRGKKKSSRDDWTFGGEGHAHVSADLRVGSLSPLTGVTTNRVVLVFGPGDVKGALLGDVLALVLVHFAGLVFGLGDVKGALLGDVLALVLIDLAGRGVPIGTKPQAGSGQGQGGQAKVKLAV